MIESFHFSNSINMKIDLDRKMCLMNSETITRGSSKEFKEVSLKNRYTDMAANDDRGKE